MLRKLEAINIAVSVRKGEHLYHAENLPFPRQVEPYQITEFDSVQSEQVQNFNLLAWPIQH